jgi:hypothetical protein
MTQRRGSGSDPVASGFSPYRSGYLSRQSGSRRGKRAPRRTTVSGVGGWRMRDVELQTMAGVGAGHSIPEYSGMECRRSAHRPTRAAELAETRLALRACASNNPHPPKDFGTSSQEPLNRMTPSEPRELARGGHFKPGGVAAGVGHHTARRMQVIEWLKALREFVPHLRAHELAGGKVKELDECAVEL